MEQKRRGGQTYMAKTLEASINEHVPRGGQFPHLKLTFFAPQRFCRRSGNSNGFQRVISDGGDSDKVNLFRGAMVRALLDYGAKSGFFV